MDMEWSVATMESGEWRVGMQEKVLDSGTQNCIHTAEYHSVVILHESMQYFQVEHAA